MIRYHVVYSLNGQTRSMVWEWGASIPPGPLDIEELALHLGERDGTPGQGAAHCEILSWRLYENQTPAAVGMARQEQAVLSLILQERRRQDLEWGGPEHDDQHGPRDWIAFLVKHVGRLEVNTFRVEVWVRSQVVIATLAVAAILWACRRAGVVIVPSGEDGAFRLVQGKSDE